MPALGVPRDSQRPWPTTPEPPATDPYFCAGKLSPRRTAVPMVSEVVTTAPTLPPKALARSSCAPLSTPLVNEFCPLGRGGFLGDLPQLLGTELGRSGFPALEAPLPKLGSHPASVDSDDLKGKSVEFGGVPGPLWHSGNNILDSQAEYARWVRAGFSFLSGLPSTAASETDRGAPGLRRRQRG